MILKYRSGLALICLTFFSLYSSVSLVHADDDLEELQKVEKERQAAYSSLNAINPLSESKNTVDPQAVQQMLEKNPQLKPLQGLITSPVTQSLMKGFSSPAYSAAIEEIAKNPSRKPLIYTEIGWFLFIFFFRAWRKIANTSPNLLKSLWLHLWTNLLGIGIGSVVIPIFYLGAPYRRILEIMYQSLTH